MKFTSSPKRTVGVEWELLLIDPVTYDLKNDILRLIEVAPDSKNLKPEFIQNTIEIVSDPCESLVEVQENIGRIFAELGRICSDLSIGLAGLGTHTFSKKLGILTPIPQYEALEESVGILAHTQVTFGHHVHVGVQSGDEVVAIINHLLPYVPVIVAISANSPFWRGYDTGHSAYRHRILASSRSYGIPPVFEDWNACSDFIDHTMLLEIYKSVNDIHWDIRPRPRFGTVEVRLMDSQPTLEETNDITAFVYTLIIDIARHIEHGTTDQLLPMPHPWIQKENHFQAARVGIDAKYIGQSVDQLQSLKEITLSTMEQLEPISSKIGAESNIQNIRDRIQQGTLPYQRQKSIYADGGTKKIIKEMLL